MKKSRLTKLIAIVLSLTLAFASFGGITAGASSIYPVINGDFEATTDNVLGVIFSDIIDSLLRIITDIFSGLFNDGPGFVPEDEPETNDKIAANYYEGTGNQFKTSADEGAQWYLGYSSKSLIPSDYSNGTYYLGGYIGFENGLSNVVEGIATIDGEKDDMKVRCIALKDGANSPAVLFATIDCIGITNADIKDIRELLKDFADANNIVSINISSTHTHSCIDTEGLWTKTLSKIAMNGINNGLETGEELVQGTNPAYMEFLKDRVASALVAAFNDMKAGTLSYTNKDLEPEKTTNWNTDDDKSYFNNKNRPSAGQTIQVEKITDEGVTTVDKKIIAMTDISRFIFTPDEEGEQPTMMLNIAAHPDVAGLPTSDNSGREISGDYLFYCGKFLEEYGYNFMFFQGAIAGIYMDRGQTNDGVEMEQRVEQSKRYGEELARMALSLTLTKEQVEADDKLTNIEEINAELARGNEGYTIWYENWNKDADGNDVIPNEVEVEPFLNLLVKQVEVPVSNSLIAAIGKLNMANYVVLANEDGTYSTVTEIGYMELGNQFKTVFLPGEICQDLIVGGDSLKAQYSVTAQNFAGSTAAGLFGSDVKCFGLMNDAIGYVVPDNDYTMGDPVNHYHELISLGQGVASALMNGLKELAADIVRV